MTAATKISSCIDCGVSLLGERLRCPACHGQYASSVVAPHVPDDAAPDDDVTAPRPLHLVDPQDDGEHGDVMPGYLTRWVAIIELIAILGFTSILLAKGCS